MVRVIIESQCWDILLDIKCSADIKQIFPSLSEKKKKCQEALLGHQLRILFFIFLLTIYSEIKLLSTVSDHSRLHLYLSVVLDCDLY